MHFFLAPGTNVPYPLGPQPAGVRGTGRHGGNSATDERHSLAGGALVEAPPYSAVYSRRIPNHFPGEDGGRMLLGAYQSHNNEVASYFQPGQQSAAAWQDDQYLPDHRALLQRQSVAAGQALLYNELHLSRPPVNEIDYNLGQVTTDYAMGA